MNADPEHVDARLDDWLDERLSADERRDVERHLEGCGRCRRLRDALATTRSALRAERDESTSSRELEARVSAALDREDGARGGHRPRVAKPTRQRIPLSRWILAGGAAAALVAAVLLRPATERSENAIEAIFVDHERIAAGTLAEPVRVADAEELVARWRRARLDFPARVLDLTPMGVRLVGGDAPRLGAGRAARAVYRSTTGYLVCWMFLPAARPLPPAAERRFLGGFDFGIYRRGERTLVVWREGRMLCALVGAGDPEEVVALAVAKAMAARPEDAT